ncbi:MAG: hypothetical protein R3B70_44780 [Polyangiaceae bacterium]
MHGRTLATRALEAERVDQRVVSFATNAYDLHAGAAFHIANHPHASLPLLRQAPRPPPSIRAPPARSGACPAAPSSPTSPYRPRARAPNRR